MKTAVFSNGHTDTYKGKRDVTAAWMIVTPDGKIISGHSLDKKKALKTAQSQPVMHPHSTFSAQGLRMAHYWAYAEKTAKTLGYKNAKEYNAAQKAKNAAWAAQCKIEVVEI